MAEKFYHTNIKKQINIIASDSKRYKYVEIEHKIPLPHPNMEKVFHYKPEVTLTTKLGKKIVFEVLDDQLKDHNLIIADIIQSYLVEGIFKVIFIAKNNEGTELTKKLSSIIGALLQKKGFFKIECPEVIIYCVTYDEAKASKKLCKILRKYAKEDKWN